MIGVVQRSNLIVEKVQQKLNQHFISDAEKQWDNLAGNIPFTFADFIAFYVATCWNRWFAKVGLN